MGDTIQLLQDKLLRCRNTLYTGYTSTTASDIQWLNSFCAEFGEFASMLHKFLVFDCTRKDEVLETIFLCLTQITTCIRHMERTIKAEVSGGFAISASRQHFLDRMIWCMDRIKGTITSLATQSTIVEDSNFVSLMDRVLEDIAPYSSFHEGNTSTNVAEECAEAMFASKQIRCTVDMILSHTLAFANVTLKNDKKVISVLCQKVIRECMAFEEECSPSEGKPKNNQSDRKLKAMSLENSLYQLEDFINESLLRLVFTTFLDYSKFSIQKLRSAIRLNIDDSALDEAIADFDVNVDRTTQIGVFAIAFAPNVKVKTIVRSCLASLESLDSCIIPSLQSNCGIYSEILEQHFNEEVDKFKVAIQEIIDSNAFCSCYLEIITDAIASKAEQLNKEQLTDVLDMGDILKEHLQLNYKYLQLHLDSDKRTKYEKFVLMLQECQAVLACLSQVEPARVLKRFKILRSVLSNLRESMADSKKNARKSQPEVLITSDELCESEKLLESVGITPLSSSILYRNEVSYRKIASTDSLQVNLSNTNEKNDELLQADRPKSIRRRESLRTTMFKRQKSNETDSVYKLYKENSTALHISEILDHVTMLSRKQCSIAVPE